MSKGNYSRIFLKLLSAVFLLLIICSIVSCTEIPREKRGMLRFEQLEKEVVVFEVDTNIAKVYGGYIVGRNEKVTRELKKSIGLYTRGAFGNENDLFLDNVFLGMLQGEADYNEFVSYLGFQNESMEYTLIESYTNYISRIVETKRLLLLVAENRTKFDVRIKEGFYHMEKPMRDDFTVYYGKKFVSYDEESHTFHVDGSHMIYSVTPKDTLRFKFVSEKMMHLPEMRSWVSDEEMTQIRSYFAEAPLYKKD